MKHPITRATPLQAVEIERFAAAIRTTPDGPWTLLPEFYDHPEQADAAIDALRPVSARIVAVMLPAVTA